jgi:hypothetical protein
LNPTDFLGLIALIIFFILKDALFSTVIINSPASSHKPPRLPSNNGVFHFEVEEGKTVKTEKFLVRSASGPFTASLQRDEAELSKSLAEIPPWIFNENTASASTRMVKASGEAALNHMDSCATFNFEANNTGPGRSGKSACESSYGAAFKDATSSRNHP